MKTEDRKNLIRHTLIVISVTVPLILVILFFLDLRVSDFFARPEMEKIYYYSREITNIGYSIHYFAFAAFGIFFSKILYPRIKALHKKISAQHNLLLFQWSWFSIKVLILTGIPVHLIKISIGRQRPHVSENFSPFSFEPFNLHPHWNSFPSGHTQVLFSMATIALLIWPKQRYLFLGLAFILSFTRVTIHQHFLSDVLAGACVGYLSTLWLYYFLNPEKKQ